VIALANHPDQLGFEIATDLGEDLDHFAIPVAGVVFGHKNQIDCVAKTQSTVTKTLVFIHRPNYKMRARSGGKHLEFEILSNGEQRRQMSRFAGCAR
jgi:hypothetical protein